MSELEQALNRIAMLTAGLGIAYGALKVMSETGGNVVAIDGILKLLEPFVQPTIYIKSSSGVDL